MSEVGLFLNLHHDSMMIKLWFFMISHSLKIICLTAILVSACTPSNHHSFVKRSDGVYKSMIAILEKVEHTQDFYLLESLKPLYVEIAELLILSLKQEERHPHLFNLEILEAPHAEKLKEELARVYALEGGRSAVEMVAREGLIVLQKSPYQSKKKQRSF